MYVLAKKNNFIPNESYWPISFSILRFLIWIFIFIFLKEILERLKISYKLKTSTTYSLTENNWSKDWIYNGKTKILNYPLRIRVCSSRAGCLLKKKIWKNFKMDFKMHFLKNEDFKGRYAKYRSSFSCTGFRKLFYA